MYAQQSVWVKKEEGEGERTEEEGTRRRRTTKMSAHHTTKWYFLYHSNHPPVYRGFHNSSPKACAVSLYHPKLSCLHGARRSSPYTDAMCCKSWALMHRPDGDEATPPLMFFGVAAQHLAMSTQVICPNECQQNHNKKQNNNARSINTHFPSPRRNHDTSTHADTRQHTPTHVNTRQTHANTHQHTPTHTYHLQDHRCGRE